MTTGREDTLRKAVEMHLDIQQDPFKESGLYKTKSIQLIAAYLEHKRNKTKTVCSLYQAISVMPYWPTTSP